MKEKKVYECDHCGTMLEEGDDYVTILAKLKGADLLFTNLRFCCPDCANKFAEEHADGGVIGVMPVMADINVIPNTDNHDFIKWNYIEGKQSAVEHDPDAVERQSWSFEEDYDEDIEKELDRATEELYDFDSRSDLESDEDEYDDWWEEDDGDWEEEESD